VVGENEYFSYYTFSSSNQEELEIVRGIVGLNVVSIIIQVTN